MMNKQKLSVNLASMTLVGVCLFFACVSHLRAKSGNVPPSKKGNPTKQQAVRIIKIPEGVVIHTSASSGEASMAYFRTVNEAVGSVDAVVLGHPTQTFVEREHGKNYFPQEDDGDPTRYTSSQWARGAFHVERVLTQKSGVGLRPGARIRVAEPVGLSVKNDGTAVKFVIERCYDIKANSKYVLFIRKGTDGTYGTNNFNMGRFNTDGTDCEDEVGITSGRHPDGTKTLKQQLREQLTTQYGIAFAPIGPCAMINPVRPQAGSSERNLSQSKPRRLSVESKLPNNLIQKNIRVISGHYQVSYLESLDTVIQEIDAIVVGKPTQDFISREHRTEYVNGIAGDDPTQRVSSRWSRGPFVISRVLHKKTNVNLSVGQTISVAEPVGLDYDADFGALKSIVDKCYELKKNSEYVLFIGRGTDGTYGTDNLNLGRFNTDGTDCEDETEATNGMYSGSTVKTPKQKLREEIRTRYGITFAPIGPCAGAQPRISAMVLGRPRPDGATSSVSVRITPPQASNSLLQIEKATASSGPWTQIASVPVIASAQTGTADVTQTQYFTGLYSGNWVRYRILNGNPSAWSAPVTVRLGL